MKRWNGWGDEQTTYPLPDLAKNYLENLLGEGNTRPDASLEEVLKSVPESRLPSIGTISLEPEERLRHACGQSLPDWINLRSGRIPSFPDGVLYPTSDDQIKEAFEIAFSNQLILIPYGGGTSVVRHINPPQSDTPVLTIDLSNLDQLVDFDETSLLATFEAGIRGPHLEQRLNKLGYTLGHFPQSFEFSTLGGWVATRSSGQQSYYYGRIEDLFRGGYLITPQGSIDFPSFPASAAGPDLRHLVLGSEGRYGILSRATVAIKPIPEVEEFYGYFFKEWEAGMLAVRNLAQKEIQLSMVRLSDAQETETTLFLTGRKNLIHWAEFGLEKLGYRQNRSLLIIGVTGDIYRAIRSLKAATHICRKNGGLYTGKFIGRSWRKSRFLVPYLRNSLWDSGYALDTLETAIPWSKVQLVKDKTIEAITSANHNQNERVLVFGHLSHVYPTGASIYITYIFRRSYDPDENIHRWHEMKSAASKAIIDHGGTISHQHGVGRDHARYLENEKGKIGINLLSKIGQFFDPEELLNRGVMFEDQSKN